MLTIQPGLTHNYNRVQAFKGSSDFQKCAQDVDFEEVYDSAEQPYFRDDDPVDSFDIEQEKYSTKKELDLWRQTKANVDSIAKQADMVPGVKTGTKILSGLTAVAIGWGGLRWGTVGTLEVLSKIGSTDFMKSIGKNLSSGRKYVSKKMADFGKYISGKNFYKSASKKIAGWEEAFQGSSVGKTLTGWKKAVQKNSIFQGAVALKDNTVKYFKNLNYKRVFVETMGVAGGGTAAVNVLGGKAIDGSKQQVDVDKDGNFFVNGKEKVFYEGDVSDAA